MIIDTLSSLGGMVSLFGFIVVFGLVYHYILRTWFYFSDRRVKFARGLPLLGSAYRSLLGLEPAAISYRRYYRRYPQERFIGLYDLGGKPMYMIRDPKLINQLTTIDFDYFVNPKLSITSKNDLFAHTLFGMRNSKWREMRAAMNPAFTEKRMKSMHNSIVHCCEQHLNALLEADKIAKMFDARDLFSRYANDIIAAAVFGVELNSLTDPDNDFFKVGSTLAKFHYLDGLKFLANFTFPSLFKSIESIENQLTHDSSIQFMRTIAKQSIAERSTTQKTGRNDMIDLLIRARDGKLQNDGDGEITNDEQFSLSVKSKWFCVQMIVLHV